MRFKYILMLLAALCFVLPAASAAADDISITVRSDYAYKVHLKFYSQTYNRSWPGPNASTVWVLDDYATHTFSLSCTSGEKICYGAWVSGDSSQYWGAGLGGRQSCNSCCVTCGNGPYKTWVLQDDTDADGD